MNSTTTSTTPSSSVESTISHESCETRNATVSASLPNVLGNNNGRHEHDMKLWCQTVVESDVTSSTQESVKSSSTTPKSRVHLSPPQQHSKRFNRSHHKQQNNGGNVGGYPPTFGQCPNTRSA
uniref:Uncharacterized protein n=1 Tax=Panagrolaimus davidi TaxID=227884 RepID=A0A914QY11_9BILA